MKIDTAVHHVKEIHTRLVSVGGMIPTPRGSDEFFLVKKAWVFGSTIKGSPTPGDLDILLLAEPSGFYQSWVDVGHDPVYLKNHGIKVTRSTTREGKMWLRKGMKMVSVHDTLSEAAIIDKKIEIFPRLLLRDMDYF